MISFFNSDRNFKANPASEEQIELVRSELSKAEAVLVGIGSGMSSASGYNHYHNCYAFTENFADYIDEYGFKGMFQGYYHLFSTPQEQWAYYSRYIGFMLDAPAGQPYRDLFSILADKDYFVITSNGDMQASKVFDKEKIFQYQGDFQYLQCSQPCHDGLYDSEPYIRKMLSEFSDFKVPYELIPRCPQCGRIMTPWVRDNEFLEGSFWLEQQSRYGEFLNKNRDKRLLLLELGVGDMTPSVIKFPFCTICAEFENAHYISVNLAKSSAPAHLGSKATAISDDLSGFLKKLSAR